MQLSKDEYVVNKKLSFLIKDGMCALIVACGVYSVCIFIVFLYSF